jgi:hypothetical protein
VHLRVPVIPDSSTRALRQIPTETSSRKSEEMAKIEVNFADEISLSYSTEFFNML